MSLGYIDEERELWNSERKNGKRRTILREDMTLIKEATSLRGPLARR